MIFPVPAVFLGIPGWIEILILALLILLFFGNRLPNAMRSMGKSIVEFKKGVRDADAEEKNPDQTESDPKQGDDA